MFTIIYNEKSKTSKVYKILSLKDKKFVLINKKKYVLNKTHKKFKTKESAIKYLKKNEFIPKRIKSNFGMNIGDKVTLELAVEKNNTEDVINLVNNFYYDNDFLSEMLELSAIYLYMEIFEFLINKVNNVSKLNKVLISFLTENSPMMMHSELYQHNFNTRSLQIVRLLIDKGADNFNKALITNIHTSQNIQIAKYIISKINDVSELNKILINIIKLPLISDDDDDYEYESIEVRLQTVKLLVNKGANIDQALEIARNENKDEIVDYLQKEKTKIEKKWFKYLLYKHIGDTQFVEEQSKFVEFGRNCYLKKKK